MKRHVFFLMLTGSLLTLGGCTIERNETQVRSVNLLFDFRDASFFGSVASSAFAVPEVTRSVADNGAVLMYFREQGTWTALPYTFGVESRDLAAVDFTVSLGFAFETSTIEFFTELSSDADVVWDDALSLLPLQYELKAVIINDRSFRKNGPDPNNYEAVRDFYGLTD
ncbi:MAG: hypothetical protein ACOCSK_02940 [Rhodothermales bacterium]